ncbi:MAG: T9SS type A sorting domain-containing protein [candidate division KSB1 bacterium]|nr:T9SS type A sorting domain-containing protein [candidate division KSB1 bacterium]
MRKFFCMVVMACSLVASLLMAQGADQDTLVLDPNQFVNGQILGDTTETGERLNPDRVYKVERNKFYLFDGRLDVEGFKCEIVGPYNGPIVHDTENGHPPVLLMKANDNGQAKQFFRLYTDGEFILKNSIYAGLSDAGVTTGRFMDNTSGKRVILDNLIVSQNRFQNRWLAENGEHIVRNCVFMNHWDGSNTAERGVGFVVKPSTASFICENNTFVNMGAPIRVRDPQFETETYYAHNTCVNTMMHELGLRQKELIAANNLYYNWSWVGYGDAKLTEEPLDLLVMYLADNNEAVNMDSVSLYFGDNAFYRETALENWYNNQDTVQLAGILPPSAYDYVALDDNWTIGEIIEGKDPQFSLFDSNSDSLIGFLEGYFAIPPVIPAANWLSDYLVMWDENGPYMNQWPLPFDLSYSNPDLMTAASDGLPLGDLNWFPEKKAEYEANREAIVADLAAKKSGATGVETAAAKVSNFNLLQNYPNPFNPTTTIAFSLKNPASVKVTVYNTLGQQVETLLNKTIQAGAHSVIWNAGNNVSGVYFYELQIDGARSKIMKMMLVK